MLVVNPAARAVSSRLARIVARLLAAELKTEVVTTGGRGEATVAARDAVERGFDAVVTLGGDGTVNEAVQALAGSGVALGVLPGGMENVLARTLGGPQDPVTAALVLSDRLRSGSRRTIPLGRLDDRLFTFAAGMGLDAEVVRRSEQDPEAKARLGEWAFVANAFKVGLAHYAGREPQIDLAAPGRPPERVLFAVCCNARPFTYLRGRPVDVCPCATLDGGLDVFARTRLGYHIAPGLVWSLFVSRRHPGWKHSRYYHDITSCTLRADRPLPVQVDGEYLGERPSAELALVPDALDLVV